MILPPPKLTRTATHLPYTTLFRSHIGHHRHRCHRKIQLGEKALRYNNRTSMVLPVVHYHGTPIIRYRVAPVRVRSTVDGRTRGGEVSPSRSEEHTSELQSLMRISYTVFCLKKKKKQQSVSNK